MYLTELPRILTWQNDAPELPELHRSFVDLLARRTGELMARLVAFDRPALVTALGRMLDVVDDDALVTTLCAPEVSFRLTWPQSDPDEAATFILDALVTANAAVNAAPAPGRAPQWLPEGDGLLWDDGQVERPWGGLRGIPVDAGSPYGLSVDLRGTTAREPRPHSPLAAHDVNRTLRRLANVADAVAATCPHAWTMVRDFTKALVVLPDRDAPTLFSSGSSGQFVGRTTLANPHLAKVTDTLLVEALVQEAIHSVLYMDEQHDSWALAPGLDSGSRHIESPWTGAPLSLRSYLQAPFVWFGLLSFWSHVLPTGAFPRDQVRWRLDVASAGFLRGDLLERVAPVASNLSDELSTAVAELARRVRDGRDVAPVVAAGPVGAMG